MASVSVSQICPWPKSVPSLSTKVPVPADLESEDPREVLPSTVRWWPESVGFVEASVTPFSCGHSSGEASPCPSGTFGPRLVLIQKEEAGAVTSGLSKRLVEPSPFGSTGSEPGARGSSLPF